MKVYVLCLFLVSILSCNINNTYNTELRGTWKMVYAEVLENDSLKVKNLTNTHFIKIINKTHFAFFNQDKQVDSSFYSGGGTYILNDNVYVETLNFTMVKAIRNHTFPFEIAFKGDTLIQSGVELVNEANINRKITEKYIKIN